MAKQSHTYKASICRDWDENDPSTYDPGPIWESEWFGAPGDALEALDVAIKDIEKQHPWDHGYTLEVTKRGPRGGLPMGCVTLERSAEHPSLTKALAKLVTRVLGARVL